MCLRKFIKITNISPHFDIVYVNDRFLLQTEEEIIDQIHSLGEEIDEIQDELTLSRERGQYDKIIERHHRSVERLHGNKAINSDKGKKQPKTTNRQIKIVRKSKQTVKNVKDIKVRQFYPDQIRKSKQKLHQSKERLYQDKTIINLKQNDKIKLNRTQKYRKVSPKFDQKLKPDYENFIQKNMQKIVRQLKEEKQILQPTNSSITHKKEARHIDDKSTKIHTQHAKSSIMGMQQEYSLTSSRQKLNRTLTSTLFTNSLAMQQRKQQKIQQYRQQQIQQQMSQLSFYPQTYTQNYKPKSSFISKKPEIKNFMKRQQVTKQTKRKNHLKQLKQVMDECSFQPRLNVKSRQAESIVKEIWRSSSRQKQVRRVKEKRSIEKFYIPHNQSYVGHSIDNSFKTSMDQSYYQSQRKSLMNDSKEISVQDSRQLSFLLS